MVARITYRSEIYVEGTTLEDIKKSVEFGINLDPIGKDEPEVRGFAFVEIVSVEDADNDCKDLLSEYNSLDISSSKEEFVKTTTFAFDKSKYTASDVSDITRGMCEMLAYLDDDYVIKYEHRTKEEYLEFINEYLDTENFIYIKFKD